MSRHVARCTVADLLDVRWQVLRSPRPRDTAHMQGDDAPGTRHWAAWHDGQVVGCVSVMVTAPPEGAFGPQVPALTHQLRGMAVLASQQGRGVGLALVAAVCAAQPTGVWCNARQSAVGFYRRAGWHIHGPAFDVAPIGPHHRMWCPPSP